MSQCQFESAIKDIAYSQETVYNRLSDLRHFASLRNKLSNPNVSKQLSEDLPSTDSKELLQQFKDMEVDVDTITFNSSMGKVTLRIIEREACKCIKFEAEGSPLPLNVWIQLLPTTESSCKMKVTLRAEVNMFMKAMVSKPLQQAVEGLADMLCGIPYDN